MKNLTNQNHLLASQYKTSENLSPRIQLHLKYSTNPQIFYHWIFDQFQFKPKSNILEIGCGNGNLWKMNQEHLTVSNISLTLSDFSAGMLKDAQKNLGKMISDQNISFKVIDVQKISLDTNSFDIIIANHMLYHVPDLNVALSEITRVLVPDGIFYASTNGAGHLKEMYDLLHQFDNQFPSSDRLNRQGFYLEHACNYLQKCFTSCTIARYNDSLLITDAQALVDYVVSWFTDKPDYFTLKKQKELYEYFDSFIKKEDGISIFKDAGLVTATNLGDN